MKKIILFFTSLAFSLSALAQTTWNVDPYHSFVNFSVKHMGISFVNGSFKSFKGSIQHTKEDLSDAKIQFTVDVSSITTGVDMRDKHLKSDDFFNTEQFPEMKFESTSLKKLTGNQYELNGKLSIRDVTKDVKFDVIYGGTAEDQQGNTKAGFQASTSINRLDYHIKFDPTGTGVGKDVSIQLNLEFSKAK